VTEPGDASQSAEERRAAAREWVQVIGTEVFADLTWEQIAELRENIAETLEYEVPPEKLVAAVESTSPKLAAYLQHRSPQEISAILSFLVNLISMWFQIYAVVHPVTPTQVTQIINIVNNVQTTVVNVLPPGGPPGGGQGPTTPR
jgi:hypothetical protein